MSWSKIAISQLQQGKEAKVRPRGHSMTGKVNDGNLVTISPCETDKLEVGDVVLVKVKGAVYLHLIKAKDAQNRFLIGNNRGGINGWASPTAVYGVVTQIEL
jgi:SOS-response transcriptional repressor LexA